MLSPTFGALAKETRCSDPDCISSNLVCGRDMEDVFKKKLSVVTASLGVDRETDMGKRAVVNPDV